MNALDVRAIRAEDAREAPFPAVEQDFRVVIAEDAFDQAVARGSAQLDREIGGVLVGEVLRDESGPYVHVQATIDAAHADEKGAELTFTHATWDHIHKEMDSRYEGKRVLGWYHTHPGFGVFLSDRDQFICQSFFNLPYQIALVYDPKSREHGLFTWREGDLWRPRGYWVGAREHRWDGVREPAGGSPPRRKVPGGGRGEPADEVAGATLIVDREEAAAAAHRSALRAPADPDQEPPWGPGTMLVAALAIALVAGGLGWYLGSSRGGAEAVVGAGAKVQAQVSEQLEGLNAEIIGAVRAALDEESVARPLGEAVAKLQRAGDRLAQIETGDPAVKEGLEAVGRSLAAGTSGARKVLADQKKAGDVLSVLEARARRGSATEDKLMRELVYQRAAVGALYAELAQDVAKAGDTVRARRLLEAAAVVDPSGYARYQKVLETFMPDGTLPRIQRDPAPKATRPAPDRGDAAPAPEGK